MTSSTLRMGPQIRENHTFVVAHDAPGTACSDDDAMHSVYQRRRKTIVLTQCRRESDSESASVALEAAPERAQRSAGEEELLPTGNRARECTMHRAGGKPPPVPPAAFSRAEAQW